jgi:hypothetical protein
MDISGLEQTQSDAAAPAAAVVIAGPVDRARAVDGYCSVRLNSVTVEPGFKVQSVSPDAVTE